MNNNNFKIREMLSGENAFYNRPDYEEVTRKELDSSKTVNQPIYTYNTENKVWRVVKEIFSVILFPIGLYKLIHSGVGRIVVPASSPKLMGIDPDYADQIRKVVDLRGEWKVKRISVKVDGYVIDAAIFGKASTLGNGRWVFYSNGNGEFYEGKLHDLNFKRILSELKGNAIVFNYPGVGSSSGMPNRSVMAKTYRAMLNLLEDQEKGVGASEIIGFGHSLGGGVQGDALRSHKLKKNEKYVFVKSRTFSDLSTITSQITFKLLGFLVKVFGWNMSSIESSKKLEAPEIIMQTAFGGEYKDILDHPEEVKHDGVIPAEASLAKRLLEDEECPKNNKYFMGIPDYHNEGIWESSHLVEKIEEMIQA